MAVTVGTHTCSVESMEPSRERDGFALVKFIVTKDATVIKALLPYERVPGASEDDQDNHLWTRGEEVFVTVDESGMVTRVDFANGTNFWTR